MTKTRSFIQTTMKNLFASIPLSLFLIVIYGLAIGWATFIEKDYGTLVANDVIYHSWWFEVLNVWLLLNILGCMYKSAKISFKISVQIFHLALVMIIIGAAITRYYGFEGNMVLKNGETSSFITSTDSFLNVFVSNDVGDKGTIRDILPLESFKKGYDIALSPYVRYSSFNLDTNEAFKKKLRIHSVSVINYSLASLFNEASNNKRDIEQEELQIKQKENHYVAKFEVEYDGITKTMLVSNKGEIETERFGNRYITLSWGPKSILLPFSIKLDKFEVLTYPGSKMESSFASYVEVLDEKYGNHKYKIFMNNVLDYRGYRFFQSQYNVEQDENGQTKHDENGKPIYAGTILSVNNDPGKIPTYIGYTLMILGALWLLFDTDSRFRKLSDFVKQQKVIMILISLCFFGLSYPSYAKNNPNSVDSNAESNVSISESVLKEAIRDNDIDQISNIQDSIDAAKQTLIVQDSNTPHNDKNTNLQSPQNDRQLSKNQKDRDELQKQLTSEKAKQFIEHFKNLEKKEEKLESIFADTSSESIEKRLKGLKNIPAKTVRYFATLQIQGMDGRIKTLDTYSDEIMRKITESKEFRGLQHNQFLLGLMAIPQDMAKLRFIAVKNKEILRLLGIKQGSYISFEDLFHHETLEDVYSFAIFQTPQLLEKFQHAYKLYHFVVTALKKRDSERNEFDKQILKLHEKMDFLLPFSVWSYMRIFPSPKSETWQTLGNPIDIQDPFLSFFYYDFIIESRMGIALNQWEDFNQSLQILHNYQAQTGGSLFLDSTHVQSELLLNKMDIFPISQYFYLILGILLFFIALIAILSNKKIPKWLGRSLYVLMLIIFLGHTFGLLLRWYIGGHAPWSNAYESMLYIAWASALSGIIILRKSYFALCGASFLAGMVLTVAHWGFMDPQIGNLQPVLQSYWLNIHVAIIVASYGFLGLSLMLGIINLILFIFRHKNRPQIDTSLIALTTINEMSMIIGILMLIVGTFLGGVWANESWGRYWSWDSKETWSLVSVGVYAFVLHIRLLKPLYFPYIFNALSVIAFYSIIMTYFGVNYYLATGMHSYAQGESGAISEKIYVALVLTLCLLLLSFFKRKLMYGKDLN